MRRGRGRRRRRKRRRRAPVSFPPRKSLSRTHWTSELTGQFVDGDSSCMIVSLLLTGQFIDMDISCMCLCCSQRVSSLDNLLYSRSSHHRPPAQQQGNEGDGDSTCMCLRCSQQSLKVDLRGVSMVLTAGLFSLSFIHELLRLQ